MQTEYQIKPALCLDFDGTIRRSKKEKFIRGPWDIELFPGVEQRIWEYRERGFLICGITNQGGVAFGLKTVAGVEQEIEATLDLFNRNPFHLVQAAYLHPDGSKAPCNHRSLLRKPDYGMLAVCEHEAWQLDVVIDWDQSLFVGDREEDAACAQAARITFQHADVFFKRG